MCDCILTDIRQVFTVMLFLFVLFLMSRVVVSVSLQQGESASECYCLAVREGVSKMKVVNIGSLALQWRR